MDYVGKKNREGDRRVLRGPEGSGAGGKKLYADKKTGGVREADALLGGLLLRGQPVDIAELFNREIITCYDSSLFVSATLSIGGDFSYIAGRLGIENFKALSLQSSFDYPSQVILYIDPEISDPGKESYNSQAAADAAEIINHVQGNCLMLFTSYKTLRDVKNILGGM